MSESIFDKLQAIDRRVFYWILFIGLMVPFLMPLGLPVALSPNTIDLWDGINAPNVEPGDVAIINFGYGVSAWSECHPAVTVCVKALFRNGVKIIFMGPHYDVDLTWRHIQDTASADFATAEYGVDHVYLGYITGGEPAIAQLASDMRSVYPTDSYGTPLDEIPMMEDVNGWQDVELVLSADTGDWGTYFLRQWQGPHGTRLAEIGIAMLGSSGMPLWIAGNYFGLSVGSRGGAELEKLIGELGEATTSMDSINVSHILVVLAVILANVGYLATRGKGGR
jgi:hypothetical protein